MALGQLAARRGLGLGLSGWLRRGLGWALAWGLGVGLGFVRGGPEPWPTGEALTIVGTVVEVEAERGFLLESASVVRRGEVAIEPRPLPHPLRVSARPFDPPELGAAIEVEAELIAPRLADNPRTVPAMKPRLFALAYTDPRPSAAGPSWTASTSLALRKRLTFESATATALYRALLLGDRSELGSEARYAYQDTGTAHLLAISGMNLALLGFGLYAILRWALLRFPPTRRYAQGHRITAIAATAAVTLVALYGKVIAPSDATDRALIAFGVVLGGVLLMRRQLGLRTLLLCVLVALALDPQAATRAGFQLSVAATCSLVLVVPHVRRWRSWALSEERGWSPRRAKLVFALGAFLLANLVTSIVTLPIGLAWFGQLPLHGLWVNLIAIPMMSLLVFPAGVIWLVTATLVPPLGDLLAPLLVAVGESFNAFILWSGGFVGASSTASWPILLAVAAAAAMLLMLCGGWLRRGAVLLAAVSLVTMGLASPREGLTLVALDVGHGDAIAMRLPGGERVLVDTGGHIREEANRLLGERVVVPSLLALGFDRLDLLIISHADLDHVGAAVSVASRVAVAELWLPPCSREAPAVKALVAAVEGRGGRVREVMKGPPLVWGGVELEILWPPDELEREDGCAMRDNDASLVLRVAWAGRRILLTGDIEARAEEAILAADHRRHLPALRAPDLYADILKSPHHGSRSSSTEAFLDAVSPRFAIVSGLPGRAPQPPHEVVLERYVDRGIETWVTGEVGAVRAWVGPGGELEVGAFWGGPRRPWGVSWAAAGNSGAPSLRPP